MTPLKSKFFLLGLAIVCIAGFVFLDPIQQDPDYHNFVDQRQIFGIPNFWNVLSNIPFLIVGLIGLTSQPQDLIRRQWVVLFGGVILIGLGSGYYHFSPDNETLFWDRLPMTIVFMSLYSMVFSEFANQELGQRSFLPLLVIGIVSVFYWTYTDDLRLYSAVQFYPMVTIPIMLLISKASTARKGYWYLLLLYLLSKLAEHFDQQIFEIGNIMSGHSVKHLLAALALYIWILDKRKMQGTYQSI